MDWYSIKYRALRQISKLLYRHNKGVYVCDEKWDNLIILDACRYDMFSEAHKKNYIDGVLKSKISRGSCTPDFLKENFSGRICDDVIYITANPYVNMFFKDNFFKIIPAWKTGWSEKYNTVLPESMFEIALKTVKKYPDKRYIVHFMQPHFPFITDPLGDTGIRYLRESLLNGDSVNREIANKEINVWKIVELEKIDMMRVRRAYVNNLYITLPYVKRLIKILKGINVVTSDHGNLLGEIFLPILPFKLYGHPCGFYLENLIKVPWLIFDNSNVSTKEMMTVLEKELLRMKIKKINI